MAKSKTPLPATKSAPAKSQGAVDQKLLRDLAAILTDTGLAEIEIEQPGLRLRVSRASQLASVHHAAPVMHHAAAAAPAHAPAAAPAPAAAAAAPEAKAADPASHPGTIKSPMVGTSYRAPAPGAANFIEIGAEVKQGQTILIIEAMKTMNQIPAPRAGRVTQIFVTDGQPVEYGEPLVIIE